MKRALLVCALVPWALTLTSCTQECTLVGCDSLLEIEITHSLDLTDGPYRLDVTTPLQSLRCSFGPETTGEATCFGYRFSDITWDANTVTLSLIDPFYDTATNPDGLPFESVEVVVITQGSELIGQGTVEVARGEPTLPNGEGCPPSCWNARGTFALP